MKPFLWVMLLRPFGAFLILFFVTAPIRRLVERHMENGRLKRLLLLRLG
jgi:hypothetical protein